MRLSLPLNIHNQIREHLQKTYPNEGGGFLIGTITGKQERVITECRIVENVFDTEEQYHRYLMEQGAFQEAEDYADANGLTLIGYFHSHPDSPAIPSEYDRAHALPNFIYLILSVRNRQAAESLVWALAEDRSKFNPIELQET